MILPLLFMLVSFAGAQYMMGGFGRPCGGCPPPMCQPRPSCGAPPIPMCPPPAPCPPQFCPPPPICPPPPPPPMPLPLPPTPHLDLRVLYQPAMYQPVYQPMPVPVPSSGGCGGGAVVPVPRIPAQNDCCCGCSSPCKYKSVRRAAFAAKTVDPSCNNSELRNIILDNISDDASESKRAIQKAAEETLGTEVNVVCGRGEFSYIAHTESFCQTSKEDVTCYAFKPL
ncbi:unnamed protein product [Caenorhabditis auriculariae]|uniref:Ground-like domain-containing protein n=1 Tax=Caenorhabditis auriculariae TaxID=2777116 RepID=A0A8S1GR75_9PELO|nr:unnamed protein product [Caenorhabditis auriculariae]